ncbi:hypothetical protein ACXYMX_06360 [Sporosarcina sp. CAU 1771]
MEKPKKKSHTVLLGTIIVLIIISINSGIFGIGGEKAKDKGAGQEYAALEDVLMNMEGVGEVTIYFHFEDGEQGNTLSDYFSLSNTTTKKANRLQGILVIAEGAGDRRIRNELSKTLSAVLQVPEHRIVISEMKKKGESG